MPIGKATGVMLATGAAPAAPKPKSTAPGAAVVAMPVAASSAGTGGTGWQSPLVNVLRLCGVEIACPAAPAAAPAGPDAAKKGAGAQQQGVPKMGHEKSGRVREKMDVQIGKRVLRITGTIPAVNYLKLPRNKSLGLTGRFCYLQVKLEPPLLFSVHFELGLDDGNMARVSAGNILKDPASAGKRKNGTLSLTVPGASNRWTLLCVDMAAAARAASGCAFTALRGIQICSTMSMRGVFTSDIKFTIKSLPRDMVLSHVLDASAFDTIWLPEEPPDVPEAPVLETPIRRSNAYAAAVGAAAVPSAGGPSLSREASKRSVAGGDRSSSSSSSRRSVGAAAAVSAEVSAVSIGGEIACVQSSQQQTAKPVAKARSHAAVNSAVLPAAAPAVETRGFEEADPYMQMERITGYTGEFTGTLLWSQATNEVVFSAASVVVAMALPGATGSGSGVRSHGVGDSARRARNPDDDTAAAWGRDGCGEGGACSGGRAGGSASGQRLFIGHTAYVACVTLGGGGKLLASGQEGRKPVVRLWDFESAECLAILCAHSAQLTALDVSADGCALLAVGQDSHARQMMALWDISGVSRDNPMAPLLAKCVTDYNVRAASFCPFEPDAFMTAGRDSMRCWRVTRGRAAAAAGSGSSPGLGSLSGFGEGRELAASGGGGASGARIRGMSVRRTGGAGPLGGGTASIGGTAAPGAVSGPNIFTAIAYECGAAAAQAARRHAFVASAAGTVFQVDYDRCCVVAVFQAHGGAVNALAVGEGIAITAGDDKFLRVWPLDFRSYLLEAEHDAPVSAAALSGCGLRLAVGCEDGTLGVLDLGGHKYQALVRSHCGAINAVAVHPTRPEYCTASSDGTARIWDAAAGRHQQLYEFCVTGDGAATAVAYHPIRYELAVGYESGAVRIFDVATTRVLRDARQHAAPVAGLALGSEGARLVSWGADGAVVVCDAARGYQPVRVLPREDPSQGRSSPATAAVAFSPDGASLAVSAPPRRRARLAAGANPGSAAPTDGAGAGSTSAAGRGAAGVAGSCLLLFDVESLEPSMCIETKEEGFTRLLYSEDGAALWALTTAGDALCFHVASGRLAQRIRQPHRHGCGALTLAPRGGIITGGADRIIKVWALAGSDSTGDDSSGGAEGRGGVGDRAPAHQSFVGHPGEVKDIALIGDVLIACGDGDAATLWRISPAAANGTVLVPASATSAGAAPVCTVPRTAGAHPDANVTMRSWLEGGSAAGGTPRAGLKRAGGGPGTAANSCVGALVEELTALTVDAGIMPSPLFAAGAPGSPPRAASPLAPPRAAAGCAPPLAPPNASPVGIGTAAASCVIWARSAGAVIYASENVIVVEDLETHERRLLQHHARPIGAMALSADGFLLASGDAEAGSGGGSGAAEVCVWDLRAGSLVRSLRYHGAGVGALAFSHDCAWLASASLGAAAGGASPAARAAAGGGDFEQPGSGGGGGDDGCGGCLVLWDLEEGEPVALGRTQGTIAGLAWLPHRPLPQLLTAGSDGVLLWTLQPEFLEQRAVTLPGAVRECVAICTAATTTEGAAAAWVAAVAEDAPAAAGPHGAWVTHDAADDGTFAGTARDARVQEAAHTFFVADAAGGVWRGELGGGRLARCARGAALPPGEAAARLQWSQGAGALAVGTSQGRVMRYGLGSGAGGSSWQGGVGDRSAAWQLGGQVLLDRGVEAMCLEPGSLSEGLVATAGCTAWFVDLAAAARVPVVCGHAGEVLLLEAAPPARALSSPGAGGGGEGGMSGAPSLVASVATDGLLRVWDVAHGQAVPAVEFQSDVPCTAAAFAGPCAPSPSPVTSAPDASADAVAGAAGAAGWPRLAAGYADGSIRLFDAGRRAISWGVGRHPSPVVALAWHHAQPLLMSASRDGAIAVTHADTARLVSFCGDFAPAVTPLHAMAVSPGDAAGGAGGGGSAGLCAAAWLDSFVVFEPPWRAPHGGRVAVTVRFTCPEVPESLPAGAEARVAFLPHSPPLLLFASPCLGAAALLFDAAAGTQLRALQLPAPATSLAASPRGGWVAFGLESGDVMVADAEGEASALLTGHVRAAGALAFAAGGELVSGAGDSMWVWQPDPARGRARQ